MTIAIILLRLYALMACTGENLRFEFTAEPKIVLREIETKV